MFETRIDGEYIYPDEPELGKLPDEVTLHEEEGEALISLIEYMENAQEVPETFHITDDVSGDQIELNVSSYLPNKQIDMLNAMFIDNNDWTEQQLTFLINLWEELEITSGT